MELIMISYPFCLLIRGEIFLHAANNPRVRDYTRERLYTRMQGLAKMTFTGGRTTLRRKSLLRTGGESKTFAGNHAKA